MRAILILCIIFTSVPIQSQVVGSCCPGIDGIEAYLEAKKNLTLSSCILCKEQLYLNFKDDDAGGLGATAPQVTEEKLKLCKEKENAFIKKQVNVIEHYNSIKSGPSIHDIEAMLLDITQKNSLHTIDSINNFFVDGINYQELVCGSIPDQHVEQPPSNINHLETVRDLLVDLNNKYLHFRIYCSYYETSTKEDLIHKSLISSIDTLTSILNSN